MRIKLVFLMSIILLICACQKEEISVSENANDTFYVNSDGQSMRVNVRGNTASNKYMIVIHGGPGGTAYLYRMKEMRSIVEPNVAVVYWDQRVAGASQGNTTGAMTLDQYTNDLKKVIQVIKARYGMDAGIYLMAHSWGGLLSSAFLTKEDNQNMVKGWMFVNAAHNYPLNDELTKQKLIQFGEKEILIGRNTKSWNEIISFCKNISAPYSYDTQTELNEYAHQGIDLIDDFTPLDANKIVKENLLSENMSFTSTYVNSRQTNSSDLGKSIVQAEFSSLLSVITIPVLVCAGEYDFVCPEGLGDDVLARVSSTDKKKLLFQNTAHNLEETSAYCSAFVEFMATH